MATRRPRGVAFVVAAAARTLWRQCALLYHDFSCCVLLAPDMLCCAQYFNYLRTCRGASPHKTMSELSQSARGRQMDTALSKSANNGYRDRKEGPRFDAECDELPLCSSRPGGNKPISLQQQANAMIDEDTKGVWDV